MTLMACTEHIPMHVFGKGYRCSRCGEPCGATILDDLIRQTLHNAAVYGISHPHIFIQPYDDNAGIPTGVEP